MLNKLIILFCGIIFGLGLTISNMTNPAKVIGFLNIFDSWDPSLAFVMGGAILVVSPLLYFFKKNEHLVLADNVELPTKKNIDTPLIIGSLLFGIGWGLVGFCPGPAISSIAIFNPLAILFVISMIVGLYGSYKIKL